MNEHTAEALDKRIQEHPIVKTWKARPVDGTNYTDPWIWLEVDPVYVEYKTREMQFNISVATKGQQSVVNVVWPYQSCRDGISDEYLTFVLQRAVGLVEYLWNNHFFLAEGANPRATITMEV